MLELENIQTEMMQALDHGPEYLPEHLFTGSRARILLGMKVHANTISHARLVALEETFPRTLTWMGHDSFNEHSRLYLEQPGVTARPLTAIGEDFSGYLASRGHGEAADLARFEWLWLEAYHAEETPPLRLADLAGIAPDTLMGIVVQAHPSASIGDFDARVKRSLGAVVPAIGDCDAILITRPEAEVLVSPASGRMQMIFEQAQLPTAIGNLLAGCCEPGCKDQLSPDDFMQSLIALLEARAMRRAG